jgi:molybdopterin-guanine dinucleotide biosynthesis protein MobB
MAFVIAIQGPSGSGKTTVIERLVPRLAARGLKVGVIKHAHGGFAFDPKGKDSWRMWQAGARAVLVAGPQESILRRRGAPDTLAEALAAMPRDLDCILVEGFSGDRGAAQTAARLRLLVSSDGRILSRDDLESMEAAIVELMGRAAPQP